MRFKQALTATAAALLMTSAPALAQADYPSEPVTMVIPFAPGGTSDFVGRVVGEQLGEELGQSVILKNVPGAGGLIGILEVARSAPDGQTILLISSDLTIIPNVQPNVEYDPIDDFAPIGIVLRYAHYLAASSELAADNVGELIALAKAEPGQINFASGGVGSSNHMAAERFQNFAEVELTHIPYQGNGPAVTDLVSDRVQLLWTSLAPVKGFVDDGQLKLLGITGLERAPLTPEVPTFDESGLPGYSLYNWFGLLAPAGTAPEVIETLNTALRAAMAAPVVLEQIATIGGTADVNSPDEFTQLIEEEVVNWRGVAEAAGIAVAQ